MCLTEKEAREYREYLERLAKDKSPKMFSNGGKDHAVVLYSVLLEHTNDIARFYCEGGTSVIWRDPEFKSAIAKALEKTDFEIKILTRNASVPDFSWLPEASRNRIVVKSATQAGISQINSHFQTSLCNFSVFDTEKFRFEYDVENYKAYGSFNEETVGISMTNLFDQCFDAA